MKLIVNKVEAFLFSFFPRNSSHFYPPASSSLQFKFLPWQTVLIPTRHRFPWPDTHQEDEVCWERGLEDQTSVMFPGPINNLKRQIALKIDPRTYTASIHTVCTAVASPQGSGCSWKVLGHLWEGWSSPREHSGAYLLLACPCWWPSQMDFGFEVFLGLRRRLAQIPG